MDLNTLGGYEISEFEHNGKSKTVLRTGSSSGNYIRNSGIAPRVAEFAEKSPCRCTGVLLSFWGSPEKPGLKNSLKTLQKLAYQENSLL